MKYKFYIKLLVLLISLHHGIVLSQMQYFSNRYNLTPLNCWDFSSTIIEIDDGYVLQGQTGSEYNWNWYTMAFLKIDKQGNKLWTKIYGDTISEYCIAHPGSFIKSTTGGYYSAGTKRTYTEDWVHDEGMIIRYNNELDTLWGKFHGDSQEPWDTAYMLMQMKQLENNDLVFIGLNGTYNDASRIYLLKTDSMGNKIWDHVYGTGSSRYYYAYSVVQTSDGGFVIGGARSILGQYHSGDPIILKVDSIGNLEWEKNLGGPYEEYQAAVGYSIDNKIIAGNIYADSGTGNHIYYGKIQINKINNDGTIVWEKRYGQRHHRSKIFSVRALEDGSILAVGYYTTIYPHKVGWILKVNSQGDSLWLREYDRLQVPDSYNGLFDVIPTSDGGLIACGDVNPYPPDTGNQDAWVIKLDSIGCDTPGCDTTVAIPEIAYKNTEDELYIYPNPAQYKFQVTSFRFHVEPCIIEFYDIFGRKVKEIKVPKGQQQLKVNVSNWRNGLYVAVHRNNNKLIAKQKFVVLK